jgi:hypothetical protein
MSPPHVCSLCAQQVTVLSQLVESVKHFASVDPLFVFHPAPHVGLAVQVALAVQQSVSKSAFAEVVSNQLVAAAFVRYLSVPQAAPAVLPAVFIIISPPHVSSLCTQQVAVLAQLSVSVKHISLSTPDLSFHPAVHAGLAPQVALAMQQSVSKLAFDETVSNQEVAAAFVWYLAELQVAPSVLPAVFIILSPPHVSSLCTQQVIELAQLAPHSALSEPVLIFHPAVHDGLAPQVAMAVQQFVA